MAWNAHRTGEKARAQELAEEASQAAEMALAHILAEGTEQERLNFLAHFDLFSLPANAGNTETLGDLLARKKGLLLDILISSGISGPNLKRNFSFSQDTCFIDFVRYLKSEPRKTAENTTS